MLITALYDNKRNSYSPQVLPMEVLSGVFLAFGAQCGFQAVCKQISTKKPRV